MTGTDAAPAPAGDRLARARQVADAVLFEGYVLYPYRADAAKNRLRFQWGVLVPPAMAGATGDRDRVRAQCVVEPGPSGEVTVTVRFLRLRTRQVERLEPDGTWTAVAGLDVGGTLHTTWDEGVLCEVALGPVDLDRAVAERHPTHLDAIDDLDDLVTDGGRVVGRVRHRAAALDVDVTVATEPLPGPYGLVRVSVDVANRTRWSSPGAHRDQVVRHAAVATHVLVATPDGRFLSHTDPPEFAAPAIGDCRQDGLWPVLVGSDEGRADVVLAAPIILEDHPQVAPESPGDWFDATEIDELLSLRVRTLTDEEKRAARATDPRAAAVVDMADALPDAGLGRLHGARRDLAPHPGATDPAGGAEPPIDLSDGAERVVIDGREVGPGTKVELRPRRAADAHDLFLAGAAATVRRVLHDVDGGVHLAVTVDDDPAADLHEWYGRFLYFGPDEVVPR